MLFRIKFNIHFSIIIPNGQHNICLQVDRIDRVWTRISFGWRCKESMFNFQWQCNKWQMLIYFVKWISQISTFLTCPSPFEWFSIVVCDTLASVQRLLIIWPTALLLSSLNVKFLGRNIVNQLGLYCKCNHILHVIHFRFCYRFNLFRLLNLYFLM